MNVFVGMSQAGRGTSPYRGRGGRGRGPGKVLAQYGNRQLIAADLSLQNEPEYQEFLKYKKEKLGNTQEIAESSNEGSYAKIIANKKDDPDQMVKTISERVILLLEDNDVKWENDPYHILKRYLLNKSYTEETYKSQMFYEQILVNNKCEFNHFYTGGIKKDSYNFSKIVIRQIISAEDWGLSPFQEKSLTTPNNAVIKYNYWDYIQAFDKVFLYENEGKTHTWFIKIMADVYKYPLPNWFKVWWQFYGSSEKILPDIFQKYFEDWRKVKLSSTFTENFPLLQGMGILRNMETPGMDQMSFFIEFSIPWIWKWTPSMGYTDDNIICLKRLSYTRFWDTMIQQDTQTKDIKCRDTITLIENKIKFYQQQKETQSISTPSDLHSQMKINMEKIPKNKIVEMYLDMMKKQLMEKDNMSISSKEEDLQDFQDAQNPNEDMDDNVQIEDIFEAFKDALKGKGVLKEEEQ